MTSDSIYNKKAPSMMQLDQRVGQSGEDLAGGWEGGSLSGCIGISPFLWTDEHLTKSTLHEKVFGNRDRLLYCVQG